MFELPKKGSKKSHHRWHVTYDLAVWYEIVCAVDIPRNEEVDKMLAELGVEYAEHNVAIYVFNKSKAAPVKHKNMFFANKEPEYAFAKLLEELNELNGKKSLDPIRMW